MLRFYFDEHMPRAVQQGLERREIEVIMAVDVDMTEKDDPDHLKFATEQGAVVVTLDREFAGLTLKQTDHAGLICWTGDNLDVGGMVRKLSEFAEKHTLEDVSGQVFWIK